MITWFKDLYHQRRFNIVIIVLVALLFVFLGICIPYGGDDWGNYLFKNSSLSEILSNAVKFYMTYEGRFFSRIFDTLLVPHSIIHMIINVSLVICLIYFMYNSFENKNRSFFLHVIILMILCVDRETFSQVYVWKTGNITYFIPMVYAFYLIFLGWKFQLSDNSNYKKWYYLLIPLTIIFSMFVENVSVVIIFVCIFNIILYYLKYRKINKLFVCLLISSVIGFLCMMFSPGTAVRVELENKDISMFEMFISNIPNLIKYTFIHNAFLLILLVIVSFILIKKVIKNKCLKILSIIYMNVIPAFYFLIYLISNFYQNHYFSLILDETNIFVCIYWIIFTVLFVFLLVCSKQKINVYYFLLLAVISAGVMMFSEVWGGRTACITTFMLYMMILSIISNNFDDFCVIDNKVIENILLIIFGLIFIFFIWYSLYVKTTNDKRNKYIDYQISHKAKEYEIIILNDFYAWNLNAWGSDGFFAINFKISNGIPEDAKLNFVPLDQTKVKPSTFMKGD